MTDVSTAAAADVATPVGTVTAALTGSATASAPPAVADVLSVLQTQVGQLASDLAALSRIAEDLANLSQAAPRIDGAILALQNALK